MRPSGQSARYSRLEGADDSLRIKVKTLDNDSTWEVDGEGSWTVRQLKDHLKEKFDLKEKRIRLIRLGRMLEDSHTLSSCGITDGDFIHAAVSEELPQAQDVAIDMRQHDRDEDDSVRGFDRLLLAGFSQTEVDILRTQFHARRIHGGRPIMQTEALDLEEEWLEQNQGDGAGLGGSNFRNGRNQMDRVMEEVSEGSQADMLLGLVMGFVFGIIMLFWIWERGIPRRQKLGILCGIACNLTMGMIRLQARTHGRVAGGGNGSSHTTPLNLHRTL